MATGKDDGFEEYVQSILDEIKASDQRLGSVEGKPPFVATRLVEFVGLESYVLHKQDIKVQIVIAEQLKRIADLLDAIDDRDALAEAVRIHGS